MDEENTGNDLQPEGQPSPEDATPDTGDQAPPEGQESSFLDDYDLGDITDPQVKATAEATVKRLNAAYTRQRMQDAQAVRDAQQYQTIVEGLEDPAAVPGILAAYGIPYQAPGQADELDDFEFDDPNERIDALEAQLAQQNEVSAAAQRAQAENAYVTEQIEGLEDKLGIGSAEAPGFAKEEIDALYLFADENRDQNGIPDVEAAFRILEAVGASHSTRAKKPRPRPPRRPGQGLTGERQVDLDDPEKRLEAGLAAARAVRASSE